MSRVSGALARIRGASRVQCAVICKARNKVFRACARKPVREATLRARCHVTRRSGGTTASRSSCLRAPLTTSREPRCRPDRWRDEARAEGNGQSLARRATKSRPCGSKRWGLCITVCSQVFFSNRGVVTVRKQPFDITRQQIDFDVYFGSGPVVADNRRICRMRNDIHTESVIRYLIMVSFMARCYW